MGQILIHEGAKENGLSHQKWSILACKYPIGWKHTKGEPLFTKKSFIMSIIVHSMLKFWWYFLAIINTSKFFFNLHDNIMELKVHFESKLIFIQRLAEGNWIKINVHTLYNLQFLNGHRASCLWFMKHYQTKENWKNNTMPIYKISSSLIW
jgi:hypothetical protein